jgi:two-component system OmpR family response regulator
MKLLVVEDDRMLAALIRRGLTEEGHTVDVAPDGAQGRMLAFVHDYDAIILDVVLPDGSGLNIVRDLRKEGRSTAVLMLTGNHQAEDVVRGLDAGADDYLTKPFDMDVLKARVRALLRRGGARRSDRLAFGGIKLDRLTRQAATERKKLQLTPKEYSLLEYLIVNAERVVTRTELLEKVWDVHFDPGSNVVDVHVARLRDKLRRIGAAAQLVTVRGAGFMLTVLDRQANQVG